MTLSRDVRTYMPLLVAIVFWASAFAGIRAGNEGYSPFQVALLRYATASVVLTIVVFFKGVRVPSLNDLPGIGLMGLIGVAGYNMAVNYGELTVPAGSASFIVGSAPIFTSFLAWVFLGERIKTSHWIGIMISFIGVGVIGLAEGGGLHLGHGAWFVLLAACLQSGYFVVQKPYLTRYTPLELVTYAIWCGTLILLIFSGGIIRQIHNASLSATLSVVYLGVFPGALGYVCWSIVLSTMNVSRASGFLYLIPFIASLIAWIWLGETPSLQAFVGGCIVLSGIFTITKKSKPANEYSTHTQTKD